MDPLAAGLIHEVKRQATAQGGGRRQTKDILVVTLVSYYVIRQLLTL